MKRIGQGNDVIVWYDGGLAMVRPLTDAVQRWLDENVSDEATYFGGSLVVEQRYVLGLIDGLREAGFTVR